MEKIPFITEAMDRIGMGFLDEINPAKATVSGHYSQTLDVFRRSSEMVYAADRFHFPREALEELLSWTHINLPLFASELLAMCDAMETFMVEAAYEDFAETFGFAPSDKIKRTAALIDFDSAGVSIRRIHMTHQNSQASVHQDGYTIFISRATLEMAMNGIADDDEAEGGFDTFFIKRTEILTDAKVPARGSDADSKLRGNAQQAAVSALLFLRMMVYAILAQHMAPNQVRIHIPQVTILPEKGERDFRLLEIA